MPNSDISKFLSNMDDSDFLSIFLNKVAYIKNKEVDGKTIYDIYGADGEYISTEQSFNSAIIYIKQCELDPVVVH